MKSWGTLYSGGFVRSPGGVLFGVGLLAYSVSANVELRLGVVGV